MTFICIQAGHEGVTSGATGAPGEQELNVRMRNKLAEVLISKGFMVQLVAANPPDSEINKDFSLFLALHGDANIYGTGGGMVDYPDPSVDYVSAESKRIKEAIESQYFNHSGIVNHPERSNANTKYYYMWSRLTAKTPCVIMEMGVVQDAHDKVILADPNIVPNAIARGICKAFNVPFDPTTTSTTSTSTTTFTTTTMLTATTLPPADPCKTLVSNIRAIAYGKGWVWQKLSRIKELLNQTNF